MKIYGILCSSSVRKAYHTRLLHIILEKVENSKRKMNKVKSKGKSWGFVKGSWNLLVGSVLFRMLWQKNVCTLKIPQEIL